MTTELADGVHWIDPGGVNAYLVEADGLVLCDAGLPWHADAIREGVRDAGHAIGDVDRVLLTHYDLDHVGALSKLDLDAPVYAGAADAAILRGERKPPVTNHKGLLQRAMGPLVRRPDLEIRTIEDGETVGAFTAYHTPGHTPGHTVYVDGDAALLGDLVRSTDGGLEPSPWIISYDTGAVRESIDRLVDGAPAFEVACPGHGEPLREGGSAALARA